MRAAASLLNPFDWRLVAAGPEVVTTVVDPGSAVFAGHYPARPVVPGVCLLDLMQRVVRERGLCADPAVFGVRRARFRDAVLPGDTLEVTVTRDGPGLAGATVRTARGIACTAVFVLPGGAR